MQCLHDHSCFCLMGTAPIIAQKCCVLQSSMISCFASLHTQHMRPSLLIGQFLDHSEHSGVKLFMSTVRPILGRWCRSLCSCSYVQRLGCMLLLLRIVLVASESVECIRLTLVQSSFQKVQQPLSDLLSHHLARQNLVLQFVNHQQPP